MLTHDVGISWNMSLSIALYHLGSNVRSHSNPESFASTAEHCIPLCDIDGNVTAYIHGSEGGNIGIDVVSGSKWDILKLIIISESKSSFENSCQIIIQNILCLQHIK